MKKSTRTNEKTKESAKEKKLAEKIGPIHRKENKMLTGNPQDPNPNQLISRDSSNPNQ